MLAATSVLVKAAPPPGYSLEALAALGSIDALIARHGIWFLIVHVTDLNPLGPMRTRTPFVGEHTIGAGFLVLPVRRRPESAHNFISVGRVAGNDVCLFDATVSKFHAYFKETDGGLASAEAVDALCRRLQP